MANQALEESIREWRRKTAILERCVGHDVKKSPIWNWYIIGARILKYGSRYCPLCKEHIGCVGCPVRKRTEKSQCVSTPYYESTDRLTLDAGLGTGVSGYSLYNHKREVRFLESLREVA